MNILNVEYRINSIKINKKINGNLNNNYTMNDLKS